MDKNNGSNGLIKLRLLKKKTSQRVKIAASTSSRVINGRPTVILTFNFKP